MADAKRGGLSRRRGVKTRAEQGRGFTLKERVTPLSAKRDSGRKDAGGVAMRVAGRHCSGKAKRGKRGGGGGLFRWQPSGQGGPARFLFSYKSVKRVVSPGTRGAPATKPVSSCDLRLE